MRIKEDKINVLVFARILIGLIFVVSGFEKIITPYQNFQYVIQAYELFPEFAEAIIARTFPWVELVTGIFLVLGLWIRPALAGAGLMLTGFLVIVGQAMIRRLPIDECGCFGEFISIPLYGVFLMDATLLVFTVLAFKNIAKTSRFSLDSLFHE